MPKPAKQILIAAFCLLILVLTGLCLKNYPGSAATYIVFTILLNLLLLSGFRKQRLFVESFLGFFFWLGYWLKLTLRVGVMDGKFNESVGAFDYSGAAFDKVLQVTSVGVLGLLLASAFRQRFLLKSSLVAQTENLQGFVDFYNRHRKLCWSLLMVSVVAVNYANATLGIYQRGGVPHIKLPLGGNGIVTWLVLFGFASFAALFLDFEFRLNNNPYAAFTFALVENFFSNVSLMSRGMVINSSALFVGIFGKMQSKQIFPTWKFRILSVFIFLVLFLASVFTVNYLRMISFYGDDWKTAYNDHFISGNAIPLVIDRFVGMEGMAAITSYPHLNWDLFKTALQEKFQSTGTSFYDITFINSPYVNSKIDMTKHHFISLPGILAFLYYPGSMLFLFFASFGLGLIAALVELFVYRLTTNTILCSLIGQIMAYRFSNFGYVPAQSYLLFGSIFGNILLIFMMSKLLGQLKR